MGCDFCGKDWVQGCWDATEAAGCGNLDDGIIKRANAFSKAASEAAEIRKQRTRKPTADEIEKWERQELARLKAKYETG